MPPARKVIRIRRRNNSEVVLRAPHSEPARAYESAPPPPDDGIVDRPSSRWSAPPIDSIDTARWTAQPIDDADAMSPPPIDDTDSAQAWPQVWPAPPTEPGYLDHLEPNDYGPNDYVEPNDYEPNDYEPNDYVEPNSHIAEPNDFIEPDSLDDDDDDDDDAAPPIDANGPGSAAPIDVDIPSAPIDPVLAMARWLVWIEGGDPIGPVSAHQIARGVRTGKVPSHASVKLETDTFWSDLLDVPDMVCALRFVSAESVPPPPSLPPPNLVIRQYMVWVEGADPVGPVSADQIARGIRAGKVPTHASIQRVGELFASDILDEPEVIAALKQL